MGLLELAIAMEQASRSIPANDRCTEAIPIIMDSFAWMMHQAQTVLSAVGLA